MDPTYKLFIQDLSCFERSGEDWKFSFNEDSPKIIIDQFYIQGNVNKVCGSEDEIILIINDGTGNAKVTGVSSVPGDRSWLKEGEYCSVIGKLINSGKLPHVHAVKLARITNDILKDMWAIEVMDLKNFITLKIVPDLVSAAAQTKR